jgi:predicted TIM-barrel fold metal-dependent hydrolase
MRNGSPVVDAYTNIYREPTIVGNRQVHFTAEDLIARMDAYGVNLSVVAPSPPFACTAAQLQQEHDALAKDIARFPRRLAGLAWAAPRLEAQGIAEAERCITQLGFKGIVLHGRLESFGLDDGPADDYIQLARQTGVYLFAYTALSTRGSEPWRLVELGLAHPDVTFIMGHLGKNSNLVQSVGGARMAEPAANVILDTSTTTTDPVATYRCTIDVVGPDRVVLGSAAPLHHIALNLAKLDIVRLGAEEEAGVVGGTMLGLLKLQPDQIGAEAIGAGR